MIKRYQYLSYLFAAALLFVIIAFFRTYFGLFPSFAGTAMVIHFHVAVILLWFMLLIIQPIFIRTGRADIHRVLGKASYVLVPLIVLSLILVSRKAQLNEKDLLIFAINIADGSLFVLFYSLAIYYRKKISYHIRFMILTVVPFLDPAAARLALPGLEMQLAMIIALLIVERFTGKVYRPYLTGLLSFVLITGLLAYLVFFNVGILDAVWQFLFG